MICLFSRCAGFRKYKGDKERKTTPGGVGKGPSENERSQASGISSVLAESSLAAVVALATSEPGLVNPAFDEHDDGELFFILFFIRIYGIFPFFLF